MRNTKRMKNKNDELMRKWCNTSNWLPNAL